jgi:hypothetical protein
MQDQAKEPQSLEDLLTEYSWYVARYPLVEELTNRLKSIDDEHRPTMQGHCTSCGSDVDWPCETHLLLNGVR